MYVPFMLGVIVTLYIIAALYFAKFWRKTRERLFLGFAIAFAIEGLNRTNMLILLHPAEGSPAIYGVRLLAFSIILIAIIDRNVGSVKRPAHDDRAGPR